jgi:hypothetical protein
MEQHDEDLTATGVIRFQAAASMATARFIAHFTRPTEFTSTDLEAAQELQS